LRIRKEREHDPLTQKGAVLAKSDKEEKKLSVDVTEGKGWKRTLKIRVPKETVDEEFETTYEKYRGEAKIPGFRKGKAPMDMVKRRFKDAIQKDVLETLVPRAYEDAVKETDLSPISMPKVKEIQFEEGTPLKFNAEIEVKPEIEVKDYTGLEAIRRLKKITDQDVEKSLDYLRDDLAELHPVDREAKFYDHLVVDLTKELEGKQEKLQNHLLFLDPHNLIREFQDALIKSKAGDTREFEVDYAGDFHNKKLAGKKVKYQITVKEVKEKVLPEVTDDFARAAGGHKSLAELKGKIEEGLAEKARRDADTELKNALVNELLKRNPFEVPDALVDYYMETLIKDLKRRYKTVDEKKVRQDYDAIAKGHIKWDILFHQIAEKEKIQVSKEQVEGWIEEFARDYRMKPEDARKLLENPSQMKRIREDLLEKNVLEFLEKNAKIKEETFVPQEKSRIIKPGDEVK
jgi:trigger factor